jgi:hypothetical protein
VASLPANQLIRVRIIAVAADSTLLASPAVSATSVADSRFIPQPISEQTVFETAF